MEEERCADGHISITLKEDGTVVNLQQLGKLMLLTYNNENKFFTFYRSQNRFTKIAEVMPVGNEENDITQ